MFILALKWAADSSYRHRWTFFFFCFSNTVIQFFFFLLPQSGCYVKVLSPPSKIIPLIEPFFSSNVAADVSQLFAHHPSLLFSGCRERLKCHQCSFHWLTGFMKLWNQHRCRCSLGHSCSWACSHTVDTVHAHTYSITLHTHVSVFVWESNTFLFPCTAYSVQGV